MWAVQYWAETDSQPVVRIRPGSINVKTSSIAPSVTKLFNPFRSVNSYRSFISDWGVVHCPWTWSRIMCSVLGLPAFDNVPHQPLIFRHSQTIVVKVNGLLLVLSFSWSTLNDLTEIRDGAKITLYADNVLLFQITSPEDFTVLQEDIDKNRRWSCANFLYSQ